MESKLIQLAVDGSWDSDDPRVYAYGGIAGLQEHWRVHGALWNEVLQKRGLRSFHMSEAMNWQGQFAPLSVKWGERRIVKRDELLTELVEVACDVGVTAFGLAADFRLLRDDQKVVRKKKLFQSVIQNVIRGMSPHYLFGIMCDREQDAAPLFLRWVENLRQRPEFSQRVWMLAFVDDEWVPAVQLADMWTYLHREDSARRMLEPAKPENPYFSRLVTITGDGKTGTSLITPASFRAETEDEV